MALELAVTWAHVGIKTLKLSLMFQSHGFECLSRLGISHPGEPKAFLYLGQQICATL
jgi:hypothetical protein